MAKKISMQQSVSFRGGVFTDITSGSGIDSISFQADSQAGKILLGGLLGREDFQSLLGSLSGRVVYNGIDCEMYELEIQHTCAFLTGVALLIEKHFPQREDFRASA